MGVTRINEIAAELHMHLVTCPKHGYSQGNARWGSGAFCKVPVGGRTYVLAGGDRDCASSAIEAWKAALKGTAYEGVLDKATYTGDIKDVFLASGLFSWVSTSKAEVGDLYLRPKRDGWGHVSICQGGGKNSEFLKNENGGNVGGKVGDQTGKESLVQPYWGFADGLLKYNGKADVISTSVYCKPLEGSDAQKWVFQKDGSNRRIKNKATGLYLEVRWGETASKTPVRAATKNDKKSQLWKLEEYDGGLDLWQRLYPQNSSNLALATVKDGRNLGLQVRTHRESDNGEKFALVWAGESSTYYVVNLVTGLAFTAI